jgi:hypothetical protein
MSGSVNTRDGAIQVQESLSATAAFAAGLNLELHRPRNVLREPKGSGELVESSTPRAIDPRVELHRDGLWPHGAMVTLRTMIG